ncbi:RsiV family protein [Clostridium sp.]|uniref:RsiV family protein n=1 Tax=Clostridium sp. TaxID=1506 RepID=UPI003463F500
MFIRRPYDINSQDFYTDRYLDDEENCKECFCERIIPPFLPGGPGPSIPPWNQPPRPQPGTPPRPQPGTPPRPQPGTPPRPQSGPPGPPPNMTPKKSFSGGPQTFAVSPGSIRPCRFQFVYIWLRNGDSFWAWLINVDRRTAYGFRWTGWRWVYFGVSLNRIDYFECFGRRYTPPEDNAMINLETQVLSPSQFMLEYPFIQSGGNEDTNAIVNQEIIDTLNSLWLNEVLIPEKVNFITVESAYEVPLNSNGLLSIVMSLYTETEDNPTGSTLFTSLTMDVNTGEVYDFGDLFNSSMNYTEIISDIAKEKANEMNINFTTPYTGVTDTQKFYLTPEGLVLYYQVDEFTPASSGLFRITILYNELSNILYPESPIVRLIENQLP